MKREGLQRSGLRSAALVLPVLLVLTAAVLPASAVQGTGAPGNRTIPAPEPAGNANASSGPREPVTGTEDWITGISVSLTACYHDMLDTFGLGSTNYPREVSRSLEKGLNLTRNITLIP